LQGKRKSSSSNPLTLSQHVTGRILSPKQSTKLNSGKKHGCRLHLRLTYLEFPEEAMMDRLRMRREARTGAAPSNAGLSPEVARMMAGGVLTVRVRRVWDLSFEAKAVVLGGWKHKVKVCCGISV
jgi:hypothetical protein